MRPVFVLVGTILALAAVSTACSGDDNGAEPAFRGVLGAFRVAPGETAAFPCVSDHFISLADAVGAAVYSPSFDPTAQVAACADGTVVSITNSGTETLGRRLFTGQAVVPFEAPRSEIVLATLKNCPAIMQKPTTEGSRTRRLAVIETAAAPGSPGVMVWLDNTALGQDDAVALLAAFVNDC